MVPAPGARLRRRRIQPTELSLSHSFGVNDDFLNNHRGVNLFSEECFRGCSAAAGGDAIAGKKAPPFPAGL
jgi:hypothetical protein